MFIYGFLTAIAAYVTIAFLIAGVIWHFEEKNNMRMLFPAFLFGLFWPALAVLYFMGFTWDDLLS